ncbi:MAG TPA: threonine/serine dehydratase [Planctomycetota bacterium]|nr:threonine/serine dehydratase [Planctomycetota bacterium]
MTTLTFADVRAAAARIAGYVHRTPVLTSRTLDREIGATVFCKCENLQKVGAFKARGAVNAILALPDDVARAGVVTHSSGNHGAAVAYAGRARGIPVVVVMPDDAPAVKLAAVRGYGADVVLCRRSERDATARAVVAQRGATLVHPFDDPTVIAGQGTAALELLEEHPDLDAIFAPVGGGGLLAGVTLVVRGMGARCAVVGAEPEAVDDAYRSLRDGVRYPAVVAPTVADGLMTGLGERNYEILRQGEAEVVRVSETAILAAARFFLERMKIVVEPSSATVLAALRAVRDRFAGRRVGLILTGGNTDLRWLAAAGVGVPSADS